MTFEQVQQIFGPFISRATWHEHPNGGGWVENSATVDTTALVGPDALVYGNARVSGAARVADQARVFGSARVWDRAIVRGNAQVGGNAQVYDSAEVGGEAQVIHNAQIYGMAVVRDNATVYDNVHVYGYAWIVGSTLLIRDTRVGGKLLIGSSSQGIVLCGGRWEERSPIQIHGSRSIVYEASDTLIQIGCICESPAWWAANYEQAGRDNGYTDRQIEEYADYLELIAKRRAAEARRAAGAV